MKLKKGSRAEQILRTLYNEGPKTRGELAAVLGIKLVTYEHDFEKLRKEYKEGLRASPPRRNTKTYPYLAGTLSYMNKARYKKKWEGGWDEFKRFYKPWIWTDGIKWEITEYGIQALEVLDNG